MFFRFLISYFCLIGITSKAQNIDIQGHRGARGKMPENTIPAFIYALDQGVTTLELDVVISKDKRVIVSHEPWMDHLICTDSEGNEIETDSKESYNIYEMEYAQIAAFDCGMLPSKRFPEQVKLQTTKPLLIDMIKASERHVKGVTHYEVNYNIEIKSAPSSDGIFHPGVKEFSDLVYEVIDQYLPWGRVIIQSFDIRVLQYWHNNYPSVTLAYLTESLKPIEKQMENLAFTPDIYSPYYKLLTKSKIQKLHELDMEVIPWTINDQETMKTMVSWDIDGIITDYPDRAKALGLTKDLEEIK